MQFFKQHGIDSLETNDKYNSSSAQRYKYELHRLCEGRSPSIEMTTPKMSREPSPTPDDDNADRGTPPNETSNGVPISRPAGENDTQTEKAKVTQSSDDLSGKEPQSNGGLTLTSVAEPSASPKTRGVGGRRRPNRRRAGKLGVVRVEQSIDSIEKAETLAEVESRPEVPTLVKDSLTSTQSTSFTSTKAARKSRNGSSVSSTQSNSASGDRAGFDEFASAKAISSDAYFRRDKEKSEDMQTRLRDFENAGSISSSQFFGNEDEGRYGDEGIETPFEFLRGLDEKLSTVFNTDFETAAKNIAMNSKVDLKNVKEFIGDKGKTIQTAAQGFIHDIVEEYQSTT